jgi:hypothetical protein
MKNLSVQTKTYIAADTGDILSGGSSLDLYILSHKPYFIEKIFATRARRTSRSMIIIVRFCDVFCATENQVSSLNIRRGEVKK